MDERRRVIRELEDKKRETLASVDIMLETLGSSLLPRQGEHAEYRRLTAEIAGSEAAVQTVQGDIERLASLDEAIRARDEETAGETVKFPALYSRLGQMVLEAADYPDFSQSYQAQLDALLPKIRSLEERLDDLTDRGNGNVLSWIGKNAQGMVVRSFLGKNRNSLERLYAQAGEKFVQGAAGQGGLGPAVRGLLDEIEVLRKLVAELRTDLALLREERRRLHDGYSPEGGPQKKIAALERSIVQSREALRQVCLDYGRLAEVAWSDGGDSTVDAPCDSSVGAEPNSQDRDLLDRVTEGRKTIAGFNERIEKLKAAIAIDEERERIKKLERAIAEQRGRIAAAETAIGEFSRDIGEAQKNIGELSKLL
ncbi:MAG: hypothetical protein LBT11_02170 [Treponema sp.]|jgi:chromosome segregation ATPase|nr:hypothetical protein [Treponema sp.]